MTTTYYTLDSFRNALITELKNRMADSTITEQDVIKANDLELHGIVARSGDIAPTIYVDDYHLEHISGRTIVSIADEMENIIRNAETTSVKKVAEESFNFDSIKDKLTIRLLDAVKNRKYLESHPYREIGGDLVITADITFDSGYLVAITRDMAENFDIDVMFDTAISNMVEMHPARLINIETAILGEEESNALTDGTSSIEGMNTIMNGCNFGATAIAYPTVAKKIRDLYGMDYFIIPSSLHEIIVVPDNGDFEATALAEMVKQANATVVEAPDILSDNVFHYSPDGIRRVA